MLAGMRGAVELVHFLPGSAVRPAAEASFARHAARILALLPRADVQHVGSTAVPELPTKGDVDMAVRVSLGDFPHYDAVLATLYDRNLLSDHNDRFAAFQTRGEDPPVGVQLCVQGSEYDDFCRFRDRLRAQPDFARAYADLKRNWHGRPMDGWRAAKSAFIHASLGREPS